MFDDDNVDPRSSTAGEAAILTRPIVNNAPKSVAQAAPSFKQPERGDGLLSDAEMLTLVLNVVESAGDEGIDERDLQRVVDWAERARFDAVMLGLVLDGKASVSVADGEITFSSPPEPDASA